MTRQPAVWPVLANELPVGTVTLAAGTATPVKAGYPFTVLVHATDRERLSKVTLQASGPVTPATQANTVTGTVADLTYTLNVPATADGSQPISLQALLEDASGGAATTAALVVPVAANGAPTGTVGIATGAPNPIVPGQATTIAVHAEDSDGLTKIDLHVVDAAAVTQPEQTKTIAGTPTSADVTFIVTSKAGAQPQTLNVTATIWDKFNSSSTTAVFALVISSNGAPTGTVSLAAGAPARITKGQSTTILVHAVDSDGLSKIDLHASAASAVTQPEQTKTVSGTTADTTFTLTAAAAATPQTVTVTATVWDAFNNSSLTAPFTFSIVNDVTKPVATLTLNPDRGPTGVYRSGETVTHHRERHRQRRRDRAAAAHRRHCRRVVDRHGDQLHLDGAGGDRADAGDARGRWRSTPTPTKGVSRAR